MEFSCTADSWITRQSINGCLESGDNLRLINLCQGLWCHIVKSIIYLFPFPSPRAVRWQQWKASWVGRMVGRHWTHSVPLKMHKVQCYAPGKVFKCIVYCSTKVDPCKLKCIVFPNWGDLNIGKVEGETGSLWESHSASLSDFSFLQRHFQVGCNCLL